MGQVLKESDFAKHGTTTIESISNASHFVINQNVCALTRHSPKFLSRWQLSALSSGSKTMVSSDGIFRVLPSYVLWAYFITREHIAEIERELRQVKERVRCTYSKFMFQFIPTMVLIYTVYNLCLRLNTFPLWSGITGGFSPRELVTGLTVHFNKHSTVDVGA